MNQRENENHARIKAQIKAQEQEKRDIENARRESLGQAPCE